MTVRLADAEANGLALMLSDLVRANVERHPDRVLLLRTACVGIRAADIATAVTLDIEPGRVTISNGLADGRLDVKVRTDAATLVQLTTVPLRFGLPDPLGRDGRDVLRKLRGRRIQVSGLARHPLVVRRLLRLLSVH